MISFSSGPLESRNNPTHWQKLLDRALPIIDHVYRETNGPWTLGGGTAVALRIGHRLSDDVDLFVPGVPLKEFSPGRNPAAKSYADRCQYPGHYLKFELDEGEIDFLGPPLQTVPGFTLEPYRNRTIRLETLTEVIVKKIRYRTAITARDVFDIACVNRCEPLLPHILAREVGDLLPGLHEAFEARKFTANSLATAVRPMEAFRDVVSSAVDEVRQLIAEIRDAGDLSDEEKLAAAYLASGRRDERQQWVWEGVGPDETAARRSLVDRWTSRGD
jgi:hypothetical protein